MTRSKTGFEGRDAVRRDPLIVALHQQAGDPVRAPRETEEVAADIRDRFREAEERVRRDHVPSRGAPVPDAIPQPSE